MESQEHSAPANETSEQKPVQELITPFERSVVQDEIFNTFSREFCIDKKSIKTVMNLILFNLHLRKMPNSEVYDLINQKILLPNMQLNIPHYYVFNMSAPPSFFLKCLLLKNRRAKSLRSILLKNVFGGQNES